MMGIYWDNGKEAGNYYSIIGCVYGLPIFEKVGHGTRRHHEHAMEWGVLKVGKQDSMPVHPLVKVSGCAAAPADHADPAPGTAGDHGLSPGICDSEGRHSMVWDDEAVLLAIFCSIGMI